MYQALFLFAHALEPRNEANSVWVILFPRSSFFLLEVSMSLAEFHDWAKEAVRVACENALASEMLCTRGTETR